MGKSRPGFLDRRVGLVGRPWNGLRNVCVCCGPGKTVQAGRHVGHQFAEMNSWERRLNRLKGLPN